MLKKLIAEKGHTCDGTVFGHRVPNLEGEIIANVTKRTVVMEDNEIFRFFTLTKGGITMWGLDIREPFKHTEIKWKKGFVIPMCEQYEKMEWAENPV